MKKFLLGFGPFLFFAIALLLDLPPFHALELRSIDWRFQRREPLKTSGEIVIVSIDEKSLHREGRWLWPRAKIAELIRKTSALGPKLIGLDIIFAEPSEGDDALKRSLEESDKAVLGYYFYENVREMEEAQIEEAVVEQSFQSIMPNALPQFEGLKDVLRQMSGVVANLPELSRAAKAQGFFNTLPDPDGVIRKKPLFLSYRGKSFPSLALEMFSQYRDNFDPVPIWQDGFLKGVSISTDFVPTDAGGKLWINYSGHERPFPVYSATDVLRDQIDKNALKGKSVIIGATAIGIYDLRVTPLSPITPGVFVQGELLDMLYRQDFLTSDESMKLASLAAMLAMTLLIFFYLSRRPLLEGILFSVAVIGLYAFAVLWAFDRRMVLSFVYPSLNALTLTFAITSYRGLTEEFEKRKVRKAFQSYLHPAVIEQIIQNPDQLKLGGKRAYCTVLFSDVRNFTSISEKMDPVVLVDLMNEYFDPISKEIIEQGGYIDKFIGDAVMAVFGVPIESNDHALKACKAALAMQRKVAELEPVFRQKFGVESFKIGVGIHTGNVTVGNIGTSQRLNYTVMGDTVNLASRLEGVTKELKTPIVVSEKTQKEVEGLVQTRFVQEITVKGKEERIRVYAIG